MGPTDRFFWYLQIFFFKLKIIIKLAIFSAKNCSGKMRAKWTENVWIFLAFLESFREKKLFKKNSPDRPLFENCSPVKQVFFFDA